MTFLENEPYYKNKEVENHCENNFLDELDQHYTTNQDFQRVFRDDCRSQVSNGSEEIDNIQQEDEIQEEVGSEENQEGETQEDEVIEIRRSTRQSKPSSKLKDYITYSVTYPIQDYISYDNVSSEHYAFINALTKFEEPTSYEVAKNDPKWCKAME